MTTQMNSVAAVVLNWNNYSDTASCLDSLIEVKYNLLDIIVVDNGSTDGSIERIESEYPQVTVIRLSENRGFAGGMNAGIKSALEQNSEYIWILNNDLIIDDEATLGKLVKKLEGDPSIGAISPLIKSYPNRSDIWFWKGRINWQKGKGYHQSPPDSIDSKLISNEYIPFCCTLFPAAVFKEVGLFPEFYFIYYEDVDYSTQLLNNGKTMKTCTDIEVHHKRGGSTGSRLGKTSSYYFVRNRLLFSQKYRSQIGASYPVWFLQDVALETAQRLYNKRIEGLIALYRGIIDGLCKKSGKGPYP